MINVWDLHCSSRFRCVCFSRALPPPAHHASARPVLATHPSHPLPAHMQPAAVFPAHPQVAASYGFAPLSPAKSHQYQPSLWFTEWEGNIAQIVCLLSHDPAKKIDVFVRLLPSHYRGLAVAVNFFMTVRSSVPGQERSRRCTFPLRVPLPYVWCLCNWDIREKEYAMRLPRRQFLAKYDTFERRTMFWMTSWFCNAWTYSFFSFLWQELSQ